MSWTGSATLTGSSSADAGTFRVARPKVCVILPTLNEFGNLPQTLASIPFADLSRRGWDTEALVIDGGSTDGTLEQARELGLPVLIQKGRGKGGAIREALLHCATQGYRFALVMDADCTYPGEAALSLISLLNSGCGLVVGVRQNHRKPHGAREYVHRFGNAALTYVASALGRELILDLCSGFWGVDLSTWSDTGLRSTGFEIESELFLKSLLSGLSVAQIPIPYRARARGTKLRTGRDGARILLSILSAMRFRRGFLVPNQSPESSLLRSILAVCFIQGSGRLLVLTEAGHVGVAERISEQLAAGGIRAQVEVVGGPHLGGPRAFVDSMVMRSQQHQIPVIALGDSDHPTKPPKASMVFLPNTQRVIGVGLDLADVGAGRNHRMLAVDRSGATTEGFSILSQRPAQHPVGAFASLRAVLDPSVQGTVRFLGANQIGLPLSVLRMGRSAEAARAIEPPVPPLQPK